LDKQLRERFEQRGQLAQQLQSLAEDRRLPQKQIELAILERRREEALRRWQVLAVTSRCLDCVRESYEQHRQPETLQEASRYLEQLTGGRYRRVWTPLGEPVLRVDDDTRAHPVEQLSRGTREQLFLALRMALAHGYARRGAPLPMILDDVLVNFDSQRAKAAAAVLRDFAAAGQQVLVFTCHEHIFKLFKSLRVASVCLPDNAEPLRAPIVLEPGERKSEQPAAKSSRPRRGKAAATLDADTPEAEPPASTADEEHSRPRVSRRRSRKPEDLDPQEDQSFSDEDADEEEEEEEEDDAAVEIPWDEVSDDEPDDAEAA
jgi:hypothetical protein